MDVNGTRFHLVLGEADWLACREPGQADGFTRVHWERVEDVLTLSPVLSLFRPDRPTPPLATADRRGAGADRFGNWYWIGRDERTIYWSPPRGRPRVFWEQAPAACPDDADGFRPANAPPAPDRLAGLAVTAHHYLVVGNLSRPGLLVFDLHAGGPPILVAFPPAVPFTPFDLAPAPGGGVWALDREHRAYWGLDRAFRLVTETAALATVEAGETLTFRPVGGAAIVKPDRQFPRGFPLAATDPVSIEGLPDGSVLVLDRAVPPGAVGSAILRYLLADRLGGPTPLEDDLLVEVAGRAVPQRLGVVGHDLAYLASRQAGSSGEGTLYVADDDGKQVVAFALRYAPATLTVAAHVDYLPLHAYGGRALGTAAGPGGAPRVFYDLARGDRARDAATRWVAVQAIEQPRYVAEAELLLGATGRAPDDPPLFDGKERGCVWHRLFLDGCIPPETEVGVLTRAADSVEALASLPFQEEPEPYRRGSGAELPFYEPFPERRLVPAGGAAAPAISPPDALVGTWETLFQAATGRYLQVKLVLRGNGRATPRLRAVRIYYPRFSYLRRYLPAVYQDDPDSASFTERLLANMEGFNTEIEGRIALAGLLFDARTAPPDALDWLAGWLGLLFDPLWAGIQARRATAATPPAAAASLSRPFTSLPAAGLPPDRRRLFIRFARKLYETRGTPAGIRLALHLLLDPCLEATLQAFKEAAVRLSPRLRDELAALGLPYPTPTTSETALEDLLAAYLLAPGRPSKIRLVEHFQTRDGRALVAGDVTPEGRTRSSSIAATAHRFTVLVPEDLLPEEAAMVERVVRLEKPAHTRFDVRRYYDYFRVGEARLGTDSVLGAESRFVALVLDRDYLAYGYLAPAPPMDALDRLIADRDHPGQRPL